MADGPQTQADYSAGAFPGFERVPRNGCEDITDALIQDDGSLLQRGGATTLVSHSSTLQGLWDGELAPGHRTLTWTSTGAYVATGGDTALTSIAAPAVATLGPPGLLARPAIAGGILAYPVQNPTDETIVLWGGSYTKNATYNAGTVAFTQGSTTVTGSGTSWLANVEAGMLLLVTDGDGKQRLLVVRSVASDTIITLAVPWPAGSGTGLSYTAYPAVGVRAGQKGRQVTAITSAFGKLLVAQGDAIYQSDPYNPYVWNPSNQHVLPDAAQAVAMEAFQSGVLVFTTAGAWSIDNVAFDLTDAFGNPQQRLNRIAPELTLWSPAGIAGVDNRLIIPARDDVYLFQPGGGLKAIGGGMLQQYRSYVAQYTPGQASVYAGHYLLPVLSGTTPVDQLVCKLASSAWTRTSVAGCSVAIKARTGTSPVLLATRGVQYMNAGAMLANTGTHTTEFDGSTAVRMSVTTRTLMLSETQKFTTRKIRVRGELDDAASNDPVWTAKYATGRPGSTFVSLSGSIPEGETPGYFPVGKKAQQIRFQITAGAGASHARLRSVEVHVRPHGRQ